MKRLLLGMLFFSLFGKAQLATPFDNIKIKLATQSDTATRLLVQDDVTKQVHFILKTGLLSPFETINEGNGNGIAVKGRNPLFYGNVGLNAIDFSYNTSSNTIYGALGKGSFCAGVSNTAAAENSAVFGRLNTTVAVDLIGGRLLNSFIGGGINNYIRGSYGFATNINNRIVDADNAAVFGKDNTTTTSDSFYAGRYAIDGYLFAVGNGTKVDFGGVPTVIRENAFDISANGVARFTKPLIVESGTISMVNSNVIAGEEAGASNTGTDVVAVGRNAGASNTGTDVVAVGHGAGASNTGTDVVAVGFNAGTGNTGTDVVAVGFNAGVSNTGTDVVAVGFNAGVSNTFSNCVLLGNNAQASENGQLVFSNGTNRLTLVPSATSAKHTMPSLSGFLGLSVNNLPFDAAGNVNIAGGGSVTDVSVAPANGFIATVSNPTTTPIISLKTSVLGVLKGTATGALATATVADYPTFNQNTTGTAGTITGSITQSQVTNLTADLALKQDNLVSGTTIKTINGTTLLGSGNISTTQTSVTGTAGNVTGIVAIANGGTGQTIAPLALNALLPTQATNAGKVLQTDGTNAGWVSATAPTTPTLQQVTDVGSTTANKVVIQGVVIGNTVANSGINIGGTGTEAGVGATQGKCVNIGNGAGNNNTAQFTVNIGEGAGASASFAHTYAFGRDTAANATNQIAFRSFNSGASALYHNRFQLPSNANRLWNLPDADGTFALSVNNNTASSAGNITLTADNIANGTTNKYYTDALARASISLTTTGTGAATYTPATGVINVPTPANLTGDITSVGTATTYNNIVPIAKGGTGSATQNFVDLTTPQTIAGAKTLTGSLTTATTTATTPSVKLAPTGAVLQTTANIGDVEIDSNGLAYYTHHTASRGVVLADQYTSLITPYTMTSTTALQKLFNVPTNGAFNAKAGTTYYFEASFDLSAMSALTGTFSFGFGGTATITSVKYTATSQKSTALGVPATPQVVMATTAASTVLVTTSLITTGTAYITGIIRVNAAGTLIPSTALSVAAPAVVGTNSFFIISPLGTNTATTVGNFN